MKWIKFILICLVFSCRKIEIPIPPPESKDIFSKSEVTVIDGQDIQFDLKTAGKYTLSLYDSTSQNVIMKERFTGVTGTNVKKIYIKLLSQKSLYLYLIDQDNNQIAKTKLILN